MNTKQRIRLNENEYSKLLNDNNPKLKIYSGYKSISSLVKIIDDDGIIYESMARNFLISKYPPIRISINKTDAFKIKLRKITDKIEVIDEYIQGNIKIKVKDKLGIEYLVKPESLLLGTLPCMISAIDKNKAFEIKGKNAHGDLYDYSLVNYINERGKVKIICKKHGVLKSFTKFLENY
jgi:hypothetical protein